jgi:uncharacterized protein YfaS (alpha-2-macroglobulin family)
MRSADEHVLSFLDDFVHQLLDPADAESVRLHCAVCPTCQHALEQARQRLAALETLPASEASEELIQSTLQTIADYDRRRLRLRRLYFRSFLGAALAAALLICCVQLYYLNLSASPIDLTILGQIGLLADSDGSLRVRLTNPRNGLAWAGVPVSIELRHKGTKEAVHLADFQTDTEGIGQPRFRLPDWADGAYELQVTARTSAGAETLNQMIQLKRSWKVMLSSDKPVYQPGQVIHVRSLALRKPDLKPVTGQVVTFTVTDPKGNVIFKRPDSTSKFGIAAFDCPLASEILEGAYAIRCQAGDTDSKLTVDVKKYVLPKFKVSLDMSAPYYQPGQKIEGIVRAGYFFGKPVAGGTVAVDLRTTDVAPVVLEKKSVTTEADGKVSFAFTLPDKLVGREQDSGNARIAVVATVSDSAGQKESQVVSRIVTALPIQIAIIPEAGSLVRGVANRIFVYASYPDGQPARARLEVSGLAKELATNELGVASFETTSPTDQLTVSVRAADEKKHKGFRQVTLSSGPPGSDFLVRTDKAVYDGGATVTLTAVGGGQEPVFVDFIKDGQTILTETISLTNGHGEYQLDLPPELSGTVQLCAYRFGAKGLPVRRTRALYVRAARQLQVKASLDKTEYRPGRQAKLQIALSDEQGKPAPGAVSLAAVDEAVFSVLDQSPGMERTFFALEQQLLQPIYAIYPWSPDLTTSLPPVERDWFEQALFARTAEVAEGAGAVPIKQASWQTVQPPPGGRAVPVTIPAPIFSPHTLSASSFPEKVERVTHQREEGIHTVWQLWTAFACMFALGVYAALWLFVRPYWVIGLVHGAGVFGLMVVGLAYIGQQASMQFAAKGQAKLLEAAMAERMAPGAAVKSGAFPKSAPGAPQDAAEPVQVRELFPETLLWRPEIITDDHGLASLDVDLADSITTWRLTASAVTTDGRLGATQTAIRVFQPFFVDLNLPVALTRGDEISIPIVVYNYLDKPQKVELTLADGPWFVRVGEAVQHIDLQPREVRSLAYRIRVIRVGQHSLQVTAKGTGVADAVKRAIEVVPDGRRVEQVYNGTLQQPASVTLTVPQDAIEGSPRAVLKIYPSSFSQLVEGLDAIFRMPSGCFEQTSSTTYPNVLALDYLRRHHKSVPEVEAKARQFIHLGYQRLLGFEVAGGGFDWFGRPPANRTLTAYGLMEFTDMARVHDVDPELIARTRRWLLAQRKPDGSWEPEGHGLHEDLTIRTQGIEMARYSTTAYIAWAIFSDPNTANEARLTRTFLLSRKPETLNDPHVLALACNALIGMDPNSSDVQPYRERLDAMKRTSADGKQTWWEQAADARTTFYGSGLGGSVETTALATLALVESPPHAASVRGALAWLVANKDPAGTWHSTQATVLALKALLAGTGKALGGDAERRIEITWGDGKKREVLIAAGQAEVMQQIDLSEQLTPGTHRLTLTEPTGGSTGYQIAFRYHVPGEQAVKDEPLAIELEYDRTELTVGDTVTATATVRNRMAQVAPMVMLDLPIPAGFALLAEQLPPPDAVIAKYQINPRSLTVYLRGLMPGNPIKLTYRLRTTMPVKVTVPAARAYEYYDPDKQGRTQAVQMTVTQR